MALYELTDGNTMEWVDNKDVARRLGVSDAIGDRLGQSVVDHGYAEWRALQGLMAITTYGIDTAEDALSSGASTPLSILVLDAEEQAAVEAFLTAYRRSEDQGELDLVGEDHAEADAEVQPSKCRSSRRGPSGASFVSLSGYCVRC